MATRTARRVIELVAVADKTGTVHPMGKVIELDGGRVVFYRDVTEAQRIKTIDGWPLEVGVIAHLAGRSVFRVHYRIADGPLLTASLDDFTEHGARWDKNDRVQLVLPRSRWTSYAPSLAYEVPRVEMPWTVVDHATGQQATADPPPHESNDPDAPPGVSAELEREVAEAMAGFDARKQAARLAMRRIRVLTEGKPAHKLDADWLAVSVVLDYLWDLIEGGG